MMPMVSVTGISRYVAYLFHLFNGLINNCLLSILEPLCRVSLNWRSRAFPGLPVRTVAGRIHNCRSRIPRCRSWRSATTTEDDEGRLQISLLAIRRLLHRGCALHRHSPSRQRPYSSENPGFQSVGQQCSITICHCHDQYADRRLAPYRQCPPVD